MSSSRKAAHRGGAAVELGRDQAEIQDLLDRFAEALTAGDGIAAGRAWAVPAFVMDDAMVRPVSTISEVEQFFSGAKQQYNTRGITDTRAELIDLRWPTAGIALAEVRWPYLDENGNERGEEVSTYLLRRNDAGELRIQGAIMHGASPGS
jgi:hypothetical protein